MVQHRLPRNDLTRTMIRIPRVGYNGVRKVYYFRSNSSPFLSGDLFADSSDVSLYEPRFRRPQPSRKEMKNARVVFCPSHRLEEFLGEYRGAIVARVLILGNSDRDFEGFDSQLPRSVNRVFLQNALFRDSLFEPLPIGLENLRLARNGLPRLFDPKYSTVDKHASVLLGPFGFNHPERNFISDMKPSDEYQIKLDRISPRSYATISSKYKYIACPRGNGVDTHRFWETLYRGGLPVVKISKWSECIRNLNVPFVEINDWSEPELVRLVNSNAPQSFDPKLIPSLWWPYWKSRIAEML